MASPLMDQHVATVGLEFRGGRADSAPTLDAVEAYTEKDVLKRVRFHGTVSMQDIEAVGKYRKVCYAKKTKWEEGKADSDGDEKLGGQEEHWGVIQGGDRGRSHGVGAGRK